MKTKRRLLSLLLCSAVLFSLCTLPAFAETQATQDSGLNGDGIPVPMRSGVVSVSYIDADGTQKSANATVVDSSMTTWGAGWYVVNSNVAIDSRITADGEVHLILADDCELTANKGITVQATGSLTIYAQSTNERMGTLKAAATDFNNAGIGADTYTDCGHVTINGGIVVATGGSGAAGIGGSGGNGGHVTVSGGMVTATGGDYGAGIGGGIGSGWGSGGHVTISGGTVVATGGDNAAGIGGGMDSAGGSITISGGTVTAIGGLDSAGIGGGDTGAGGNITISGGTVTANGGGNGGSGIGGGVDSAGGSITISGGMVTANGNDGGAGIGGGGSGPGGDIIISSGTVAANGIGGAGIGGGAGSAGGSITISGGTVTANGNGGGSGIGGGLNMTGSGTFSTPNGSAVIFTTDILGGSVTEDDKAGWRGIIFEGDNGAVYGSNITLSADTEIPSGKTLTIEAGKTLTIEAGVTLTIHGEIINNGTIDCSGTITGDDSLTGNKAIQPAPAAPVVKNTTLNSVELEAVAANSSTGAAAEYSRDNGANWQDSPVFTGLTPNTEYTFVVRYKGIDPFFAASPPSNATTVTIGSGQHTVSVSAEPAEGGTASASLISAKQGEEITLTAAQSRGWHFKEWQVISGGVTIRDHKFVMPNENVIVKAVFEKDSNSSSGGGNSSGNGSGGGNSSGSGSGGGNSSGNGSGGGNSSGSGSGGGNSSGSNSGGNSSSTANSGTGTKMPGISTPDSNRKSPATGEHGAAVIIKRRGKTKIETAA